MKKDLYKFTAMFLSIFVVITLSLLFIVNKGLLSPAPFGIRVATNNEWISFYGSLLGGILGGVLTFGGVIFTILYYENRNKQEDRLKILPYLQIEPMLLVKEEAIDVLVDLEPRSINKEEVFTIYLKVQNIGLGHCVNLQLKHIYRDDKLIYVWDSNIKNNILVKIDDIYYFKVCFLKVPEEFRRNDEYPLEIEFVFLDLQNNEYQQFISLTVFTTFFSHYSFNCRYVSKPFFIKEFKYL